MTTAAVPAHVRSVGRVHHVAVVVRAMDEALGFYRDTLGLAPGPVVPIAIGPRPHRVPARGRGEAGARRAHRRHDRRGPLPCRPRRGLPPRLLRGARHLGRAHPARDRRASSSSTPPRGRAPRGPSRSSTRGAATASSSSSSRHRAGRPGRRSTRTGSGRRASSPGRQADRGVARSGATRRAPPAPRARVARQQDARVAGPPAPRAVPGPAARRGHRTAGGAPRCRSARDRRGRRAGPAGTPGRRRSPARRPSRAGPVFSTPSATTSAPQRRARSTSVLRTDRTVAWPVPAWTSERSIFTTSNRNWLRRRRPALPAPTSSAAIRIPAARHRSRTDEHPRDVVDDLALGDLQDHPVGREAGAVQHVEKPCRTELRSLQRARRDVERDQEWSGDRGRARDDHGQAGQVQVHDAPANLGRGEERAGVRERGSGRGPDQAFEADHPAGLQVHERLVDRPQRALVDDAAPLRSDRAARFCSSTCSPSSAGSTTVTTVRPDRLPRYIAESA